MTEPSSPTTTVALIVFVTAPVPVLSFVHFFDLSLVLAQSLPANSLNTLFNAVDVVLLLVTETFALLESVIVYVPASIVSVLSEAAVFTTVTKFSRFEASAAFLDFSTYLVYCGARMPTRIARIATTITSSTRVKPLLSFFLSLRNFNITFISFFISLSFMDEHGSLCQPYHLHVTVGNFLRGSQSRIQMLFAKNPLITFNCFEIQNN